MKRYVFYLLIMAAAVISACNKETVKEDNSVAPEVQKGTYIYTVNASLPEEQPSGEVGVLKSDYDASGHFSWSTGDAISVLFHNGDDDQFFTLTRVSGTGNSATFSGPITSGYTIGASNTGKIWAFYPANANHSYTAGSNDDRPYFYTPSVIDLSGGNFSANIPMYDVLDAEGSFSFKCMTAAMKFTISDLDVSKIRVDIENGTSYGFSGLTAMSSDYLKYSDYSSSEQKKISFICDVTSETAVFYLSGRYTSVAFKPTITIYDYDTGYKIKQISASTGKALSVASTLVPSVTISAPGLGNPFDSLLGVDWSAVGGALPGATGSYAGITSIKGTADDTYVYLLLEIPESELLLGHKYTNTSWFYLGTDLNESGDWKWTPKRTTEDIWIGYIMKRSLPYADGSNYKAYKCKDNIFLEARVARSSKSYLTDPGTVYVGAVVYNGKYTEEDDSNGSEHDNFMYAPASASGLLEVTLP